MCPLQLFMHPFPPLLLKFGAYTNYEQQICHFCDVMCDLLKYANTTHMYQVHSCSMFSSHENDD